jgi:hypothetical protein
MSEPDEKALLAQILSSYLSNNTVATADLPSVIERRLIPLTQVACPVFSGFHAGLRSPQPVEDVVGGPYATVRFIDRQRGSYRPLDPG